MIVEPSNACHFCRGLTRGLLLWPTDAHGEPTDTWPVCDSCFERRTGMKVERSELPEEVDISYGEPSDDDETPFDAPDDPTDFGCDDDDDQSDLEDLEPPRDVGPCCSCGEERTTVRNFVMLAKRAPEPSCAWGCLACGLPSEGAVAVLCDACLNLGGKMKEIRWAVLGDPVEQRRIPIDQLDPTPFDHDPTKHPELWGVRENVIGA